MTRSEGGGPAFPNSTDSTWPGVTLRDYFAVAVAGGYCAMHADPECNAPVPLAVARFSYRVADVMMAVRKEPRQAGASVLPDLPEVPPLVPPPPPPPAPPLTTDSIDLTFPC